MIINGRTIPPWEQTDGVTGFDFWSSQEKAAWYDGFQAGMDVATDRLATILKDSGVQPPREATNE